VFSVLSQQINNSIPITLPKYSNQKSKELINNVRLPREIRNESQKKVQQRKILNR